MWGKRSCGAWLMLMVLELVSFVGLVGGLNVSLGVLLPNFTVLATTDECPCLRSVEAESHLVRETLRDFTWTERTRNDPVDLQISYHDTQCSDLHGPIVAMELFYRQAVNIFYGPCCKYALSPVGRYAKHWDHIPIITPGGLVKPFSNRTAFPSLTRLLPPYDKLIDFFMTHLINRYNWTNLSFLYHQNLLERKVLGYSPCSNLVDTLGDFMQPKGNGSFADADGGQLGTNPSSSSSSPIKSYSFVAEMFDEYLTNRFQWNDILDAIQNKSRIVILCASPTWVREILLKAAERKFDNGEYVFINIDLFGKCVGRVYCKPTKI